MLMLAPDVLYMTVVDKNGTFFMCVNSALQQL